MGLSIIQMKKSNYYLKCIPTNFSGFTFFMLAPFGFYFKYFNNFEENLMLLGNKTSKIVNRNIIH